MYSYLGDECSVCGTIDEDAMYIAYKDVSQARFTISRNWSTSIEKLKDELKKCELLCKEHYFEMRNSLRHRKASGDREMVYKNFDLHDTGEL